MPWRVSQTTEPGAGFSQAPLRDSEWKRSWKAPCSLAKILFVHLIWCLYFSYGWESPSPECLFILKLFQTYKKKLKKQSKELPYHLHPDSPIVQMYHLPYVVALSLDKHTYNMPTIIILFLNYLKASCSNTAPSLKRLQCLFPHTRTLSYRAILRPSKSGNRHCCKQLYPPKHRAHSDFTSCTYNVSFSCLVQEHTLHCVVISLWSPPIWKSFSVWKSTGLLFYQSLRRPLTQVSWLDSSWTLSRDISEMMLYPSQCIKVGGMSCLPCSNTGDVNFDDLVICVCQGFLCIWLVSERRYTKTVSMSYSSSDLHPPALSSIDKPTDTEFVAKWWFSIFILPPTFTS